MGIVELILLIAVVGFIVWVIIQLPMPELFRNVIVGVVCFALVIFLLQSFGLIHGHLLLK